jgi:hypothetical protein
LNPREAMTAAAPLKAQLPPEALEPATRVSRSANGRW